ncbi:hypothetical protein TB15x_23640, partial [Xanthomonas perforans]|uniref:hypothetical protein n=1 Tax=Xanthomonas perforans TaxID=442694 RepID=UPI00062D4CE1
EVQDAEWVTLDVVHQRWKDGVFATPWNARFNQLWDTLGERVREERQVGAAKDQNGGGSTSMS